MTQRSGEENLFSAPVYAGSAKLTAAARSLAVASFPSGKEMLVKALSSAEPDQYQRAYIAEVDAREIAILEFAEAVVERVVERTRARPTASARLMFAMREGFEAAVAAFRGGR